MRNKSILKTDSFVIFLNKVILRILTFAKLCKSFDKSYNVVHVTKHNHVDKIMRWKFGSQISVAVISVQRFIRLDDYT